MRESWRLLEILVVGGLSARIPRLVWRRDACEVLVSFDLSKVSFDQVRKAEDALAELGVHFDRGTGCGERHWEWDFSLEGPIQVRFKRWGKMKKLFMGQSVVSGEK